MTSPTPAPRGLLRWLPSLLAVGALALLGRLVLVSLFADSVPYWDQWDAEGANLIKPWLEHQLTLAALFEPHNEHRIAFTRLLSLGLFEANGEQWDNLVSAYASGVVHAGQCVLLYALLASGLPQRAHRVMLALAILATAWLPFGYTNALVGFQNQFFFMSLLALATIAWAARGADRARTPVAVALVALAGLFTMASGVVAAIAAGGVLVLRGWVGSLRVSRAAAGTAALVAVTVLGAWLVPHIEGHQALKADSTDTWLRVFALNAGWPFGPKGVVLVWAPFALTAWRVLRRRQVDAHDLLGLGLGAWVLLQCAAIAYSRGGEASIVGRYVDTLAVGLVVNAWLALRLSVTAGASATQPAPTYLRWGAGALAAAFAAVLFGALAWQAPHDLDKARAKRGEAQVQTANVRRFVATGNAAALAQPFQEIPYPKAQRLAQLLVDPTLFRTLPASVRLPLMPSRQRGNFDVAAAGVDRDLSYSSCVAPGCATARGEWRAEFITDRFHRVQLRHRDGGDTAGLAIRVEDAGTGQPLASVDAGSDVVGVSTGRPFRVVVSDASPTAWVAFAPPVEIGPLSAAASSLQWCVRRLAARVWAPALPERIEVHALNVGEALKPLKILPGTSQHVRILAPRAGLLDAAALSLGTYGGKSDGVLAVEVCARAGCEVGRGSLAGALDNAFFIVRLPRPVAVAAGEQIAVRVANEQARHAVAIWSYPARPDAPRLDGADGAAAALAPRIELRHVD